MAADDDDAYAGYRGPGAGIEHRQLYMDDTSDDSKQLSLNTSSLDHTQDYGSYNNDYDDEEEEEENYDNYRNKTH